MIVIINSNNNSNFRERAAVQGRFVLCCFNGVCIVLIVFKLGCCFAVITKMLLGSCFAVTNYCKFTGYRHCRRPLGPGFDVCDPKTRSLFAGPNMVPRGVGPPCSGRLGSQPRRFGSPKRSSRRGETYILQKTVLSTDRLVALPGRSNFTPRLRGQVNLRGAGGGSKSATVPYGIVVF